MKTLEKSLEGLNLLRQESFKSEMNDPIIVIDKTHLPGFVRHKFYLQIQNTSDNTLYFKLVEQLPNWTLDHTPDIPADGKLGAIGAGVAKIFEGITVRNLPVGESEDVGHFIVEAYPDDTYTGLIESHSHPTTIYIEDLKSWPWTDVSNFDDGTWQGWTWDPGGCPAGGSVEVSNEKSVEEPGYSLRTYAGAGGGCPFISKEFALPSTPKVRLSFYALYKTVGSPSKISWMRVYVNGDLVLNPHPRTIIGTNQETLWWKYGVDLSKYSGETVTIKIQRYSLCGAHNYAIAYFDEIIVAGK